MQSARLFFKEGNSDKVYELDLLPSGEGFVVNFRYGRRGAALQHGTKTASPVALEAGQKIYNKLYSEKTGKGYTPEESGERFVGTENAGRLTGNLPQLLNAVDEVELLALLSDDSIVMQEKMDGVRAMLQLQNGKITLSNRKGLEIPCPERIAQTILAAQSQGLKQFILDGELIGNTFHGFDALEIDGVCVRSTGFSKRFEKAQAIFNLMRDIDGDVIKAVHVMSYGEKKAWFERFKTQGAEGVVLRNAQATYKVGRPNSGGDALKFKFVDTATVRISKVSEGKRSVSMEVLTEKDQWIDVGNVTIPSNQDIPTVGELAEVRYLYRTSAEGALFQPVFLGTRNDLAEDDAKESQLKVKVG